MDRLLDYSGNGEADTDCLQQLLSDASSKVLGRIQRAFPAQGLRDMLAADLPHDIVRVTLDVAMAMACRDHPEVMRQEWEPLMKSADADLAALAKGEASLDKDPPTTQLLGALVESDCQRGF